MPRYFFHTRIDDTLIEDPEGAELRDADEAWQTARRTIRGLLAQGAPQAQLLTAVLEVVDSDGEIVLEFPFSEALIEDEGAVRQRPPPH
jgi:hypothetical protein